MQSYWQGKEIQIVSKSKPNKRITQHTVTFFDVQESNVSSILQKAHLSFTDISATDNKVSVTLAPIKYPNDPNKALELFDAAYRQMAETFKTFGLISINTETEMNGNKVITKFFLIKNPAFE